MSVHDLVARYLRQVREVVAEHVGLKRLLESVEPAIEERLGWLEQRWRGLWSAPSDERREARELLEKLACTEPDETAADAEYRRGVLFQAARLAFTIVLGLLRDGIPPSLAGFDDERFDSKDLRAWLKGHGASDELLRSEVIAGLYNASFCYPGGDFEHGDLSAGVSLRTILLMGFTYKGSFMWKMQASMGDVVFAPIYEALMRRAAEADRETGTRGSLTFKFFHKVTKLSLDDAPGTRSIGAIEIAEQALLKEGTYDPLVTVRELPCWPAKPRYEQIVDGDKLAAFDLESDWCTLAPARTHVLKRGEAFDFVVLAIPVGALRTICAELVDASQPWKNMVEGVKTIRTKSFQVWLAATEAQAKWQAEHRIMTDVYENDFNSVADMSQTLRFEDWPKDREPGSVMYFSTAMKDDPDEPSAPNDGYQKEQNALVGQQAREWLSRYQEGIFGWLGSTPDPKAFAQFYFRANINGDERYVLSVANSARFRLAPGDSGFDNLMLAGDWTRSTLNLGCAEGATMSGLEAGRALLRALAKKPVAAAAEAPRFIDYPGMPVYPPAYRQKGITLHQFVLEGNAERLDAVVDRYLNASAEAHRFSALGKWVVLQSGHIADNASDPPGSAYGRGQERSLAFLIPVVRWNGGGGAGVSPIDVGFFALYVFVDHPLSLIAGREVLGMPKHLAAFDPDSSPQSLDQMTMRTMVVHRLGEASPVVEAPLVHIHRQPEEATGLLAELASLPFVDVLHRSLDQLIGASPFASWSASAEIGGVLRALLGRPHVRFFSRRQLRDARDPTRAAFDEVTFARMDLGDVSLRRPSGRHTIEIVEHESHPIVRSLGLASGLIRPVAELEIHVEQATLQREL
jgi:uncharacterized protein with NAD-binding domain and iron-sulfur cluster